MKHSTTAQSAIVGIKSVLAEVRNLPESTAQKKAADALVNALALLHVIRDEQVRIEYLNADEVTA